MTTLDWIIVACVLLFALAGFRRGFLVGVLALVGFAGGALLGARLAPLLLPGGSRSPYAPLFALSGALIVGGLLAGMLERIGFGLRRGLRLSGLGALDGALGALLSGALALALAWLGSAVVLQTPALRELRHDVQRSALLRRLNDALPPSGAILHALARFDPLPSIGGPGAGGVAAPSPRVLRQPGVHTAAPSVVRVLGTACGLGIEGSGWVAGPGLVVTNAHVVAGERDTVVQERGSGPSLGAAVARFDPRNDVAVLRVSGLHARALPFVLGPAAGTSGAILGFPHDGPFDAEAGRIGATVDVLSQDAYGRGPVRRSVTPLRGLVRSGNSGGPVVDASGRVLATVFAATTRGPQGGYGVPNAVVLDALAAARHGGTVSSGACAG